MICFINWIGRVGSLPSLRLATVSMLVISIVVGCGGGGGKPKRKTTSVSGIVKLGGKPLVDADVYFEGEGFTGYGKTNSQGEYRLAQGAVPGKNKVFISKKEGGASVGANDPVAALDDPGQMQAAAEGMNAPGRKAPALPKELVPKDFSDPKNTKLSFEVSDQAVTDANFDL